MPNTFTQPLEGNAAFVSAEEGFTSGRAIQESPLYSMVELDNYIFAANSTGTVIAQHFDRGVAYLTGTSEVMVCKWRIPNISNLHTSIRTNVLARGIGSPTAASIRFRFVSELGNIVFSTSHTRNSDTFTYSTVSTTITSSGGSEYFTVEMYATGRTRLDIAAISVELQPRTSPLSSTSCTMRLDNDEIYTHTPISTDTITAYNALPTFVGYRLHENLTALQRRPRSLFQFSALNLINSGYIVNYYYTMAGGWYQDESKSTQRTITLYDVNAWKSANIGVPIPYGFDRMGFVYAIHYYVYSTTASTTRDFKFRVLGVEIDVPSGTAVGWYSVRTTIDSNLFHLNSVLATDNVTIPYYPINFTVLTGGNYNATPIQALSIWGI